MEYVYIIYETRSKQANQFNHIHLSLPFQKKHLLSTRFVVVTVCQKKTGHLWKLVKTWECPTGTVNAGFGTTWSREAAEGRSYQQQLAIQELQVAMQGTTMPKTDDAETLGAETPRVFFWR